MKYYFSFFLYAISVFVTNTTIAQSLEEKLTHLVDTTFQSNQDAVGLLIHVESPDQNLSWTHAAGNSDKKEGVLSKGQPALIASNTKTYVAVAILKLVEQGQLKLNDSIERIISKKSKKLFIKNGYDLTKITVKHLLSHTSGIRGYVDDEYFDFVDKNPQHQWKRDEQIALAMTKGKPLGNPSEKYKYADLNFLLLGEILEKKTGKPFYTAIRELIDFKKHNLNSTWFVDLEDAPEKIPPFVHQYWNKNNWDSQAINPSWDLYGGGGIVATVKDLALFFQTLFEGKIIEDPKILEMIHTQVECTEKTVYCLGLMKIKFNNMDAYYHGGFWGTDVIYIPEINTTISNFTLQKEKRDLNAKLGSQIATIIKNNIHRDEITHEINEEYELIKPYGSKKLLILFPGAGQNSTQTKANFAITDPAKENGITLLFVNFNRKLWIDQADCITLTSQIGSIIKEHNLNTDNVYIGGMSIGGNVSLLLSNYLLRKQSSIQPKGVFIVDSPIDLYGLYESATKDLKNKEFSEERLAEPNWIVNYFSSEFGNTKDSILTNIQKVSPITITTNNTDNISHLKNIKLNLYTEPDAIWWKENRLTDYQNTNAYYIQKLHQLLVANNWERAKLIETQNKGYRANGERHPHSWSIIDIDDLILWMGNN